MKKLVMSALILGLMGLSACQKEEDAPQNPNNGNGGGGGNSVTVTNNTMVIGNTSKPLNLGTAYLSTDFNTGNDYITLYFYKDDVANMDNTLTLILDESLPSASSTLSFQSGANAPGDIKANEFVAQLNVDGTRWSGIFTGDGYEATGNMSVTVAGDKITFAFAEITLGNSLIQPNVTAREEAGAKVTMSVSDVQAALAGNLNEFSLSAE